jgi:hypothetical protein
MIQIADSAIAADRSYSAIVAANDRPGKWSSDTDKALDEASHEINRNMALLVATPARTLADLQAKGRALSIQPWNEDLVASLLDDLAAL